MTEHAPSPAHEVPKPKEVKDVLKAKGPRAALYGRLLTATPESMNPSTLNLAEPADIKTLAERDYRLLQTMSVHERRDTATVPADQLDAKVNDWVNAQAQNISKDFTQTNMDPTKAARWNKFFHHFAADEAAAKVFLKNCYTQFCAVGTTPPNAGVKGFVVYLMNNVDHKELAANLDAVEHLAGMFGAETSHVVRAQVEAELVLVTQGDSLKKELKSKPLLGKHGIRINRLEPAEAALLTTADTWIKKTRVEATPAAAPALETAKTPEEKVAELAKRYRELAAKMVAELRKTDATLVDTPDPKNPTIKNPDILFNKTFGHECGISAKTQWFSDLLQDKLGEKYGVDGMVMVTKNARGDNHANAVFSLPYAKGSDWYVKTWDPAITALDAGGNGMFTETKLSHNYSEFIGPDGSIDPKVSSPDGKRFADRLAGDGIHLSRRVYDALTQIPRSISKNNEYDLTAVFNQPEIDTAMRQRMKDIVLQGLHDATDNNCVLYSWFASMMLQSIQHDTAHLSMSASGRTNLESEFGVKPLTYDELLKAVKDTPAPTTTP